MSRGLRLLMWAAAALLLSWLLGWLALPPLLKWQLETRGSALLGRELRVGEVRFVPMTLQLTLRDLSLGAAAGADNAEPQLHIDRLFVDLDARSLLRWAPVVAALEVDAPRLRLTRLGPGRYDIDDLLQRFAPKPGEAASEPARFALFNLRIADGEFSFDNRPVQRKHVLRQITLDLPFLSNLPDDLQVKVEPRLAFDFNGSEFDNRGRTTPFAEGRASEFDIRFDAFELDPMWVYLPAALPLQPTGGQLSADLKLRFHQLKDGAPRVDLQGRVELQDLTLQPPGEAPLLAWHKLSVQLAEVRPLQRRVVLDALQVDGLALQLKREPDGRLQLQRLAAATPSPAPAADGAAPAAPWQLQLGSLELKDARIDWADASLQPVAQAQLHGIELQVRDLHWPFDAAAALRLDAALRAQDKERGRLHAEGSFTDQQAKLALQLADIDAALAAPYLREFLRPQASALLQAQATLDWAGGDAPRLLLGLPSLRIDDVKLADAPERAGGPALQLAQLQLAELQADLLQRRVDIGSLSLQRPEISMSRDAKGELDLLQWRLAPPQAGGADAGAAGAAEAGKPAPPWQLSLRELQLDGGQLRFADAALPSAALQLADVRLRAQALTWPQRAPLDTQLAANLSVGKQRNAASRLDWRGRVGIEPLSAQGQLRLERLPVHVFEPYFGQALPVKLQRLEAGFQGQVELQQQPQGPQAKLRGDALLADLQLLGRDEPASELLTWNALQLNALALTLQPGAKPRVEIGALKLADFFARLEVNEQGRLNLQRVAEAPGAAASVAAPQPAAAAPAPPAPASAAAGAPDSVLSRLPVELLIESTQFSNGRVDFSDHFVRPNYRADLTELNGSIGRLDSRSRDMATLQLDGRVAGTGTLQIGGAVNPTVIPPALDIKARATDIELPGLTPYAAKYAGYPIERGKLSMDVAYKVAADGKLDATNRIIVNQLTLGPKSDSPEATRLPVPFLVALLQDKDGVIDLDLPLSGSLEDPQFSLGALIWKVITNLFSKAASSPFSVLGGGKDLSQVDFQPGTARTTEAGTEVIAKVAKALAERPQLKLGIVAMADAAGEAEAMRHAAFEAKLRDAQRRERARGALGNADLDAPLPPLTAEQRASLVRQIYADTKLPDKPRNIIGLAKDIPVAEMEAMLVAAMPVDDAAARELAQQRGRTVRDALVAQGLGSERLFLGEAQLHSTGTDKAPWVPQARLTLSAN